MIALIDVSHSFHKSYFVWKSWDREADINDTKMQGQLMRKVVTDLFASVKKLYLNPDDVYFCFDSSSWRKNVSSEYKADRSGKPQGFYDVINDLYDIMLVRGYKAFKAEGAEADDCISFINEVDSREIFIISGDEDMHQLISESTFVWNNNLKNSIVYSERPINFTPLMTDYQNLVIDPKFSLFNKVILGCSGDNVGALLDKKGIGVKTIEKFYNAHGIELFEPEQLEEKIKTRFKYERPDFKSKFDSNLKLVQLDLENLPEKVQCSLIKEYETISNLEPKFQYEIEDLLEGTKHFKKI